MRSSVIASVALLSVAFPAAAQTPKPYVDSEQVAWTVSFTVDQADQLKSLVSRIVAATKDEPDVLAYQFTIANDQKTFEIYERYANAHAAVVHVTQRFFPNFSKDLFALAKPGRVVVYAAAPTDELKTMLADFHPIYMTPFDGFVR